jgi:hypothetical protein
MIFTEEGLCTAGNGGVAKEIGFEQHGEDHLNELR